MRTEIIGNATLYLGDCRDVLAEIGPVDAVVTDPPYGLSFMGKDWDKGVPPVEIWQRVIAVCKPGAHLLSFGGTRTYHRMACAIEDAGFEIRDQIQWLYGTGFPKSHDVSKAIDRQLGCERSTVRIDAREVRNPKATGAGRDGQEGATRPWIEAALECGFHEKASEDPASELAAQWKGYGTALKPANEPIVLARKPLDGTVADNVLAHGTGGLNIDASRVGTFGGTQKSAIQIGELNGPRAGMALGKNISFRCDVTPIEAGRWPANVIHDGSAYATSPMGEAARFFYCAKASQADRDSGLDDLPPMPRPTMGSGIGGQPDQQRANNRNVHPTVKPTALMRYLCRLVTPPRGAVLDPFMGSGSTGRGALSEGFRFIGIEREERYFDIACRRIEAAQQLPLAA